MKDIREGDTFFTELCKSNRYYGTQCTKREDLKSVIIFNDRVSDDNRVTVTDKQDLGDIYDRICSFAYDTTEYQPTFEKGFGIRLEFVDGTILTKYYTPASGRLSYYKADAQFENYILAFFK